MKPKSLVITLVLTLLVIPGAGHKYLEKTLRGVAYMIVAFLILGAFLVHFTKLSLHQVDQMQTSGQLTQVIADSQQLAQKIMDNNAFVIRAYVFAIVVLYIIAIADVVWLWLARQKLSEEEKEKAG